LNVKPAVGFTLPSAGVAPAPGGKRRCGTSSLLELVKGENRARYSGVKSRVEFDRETDGRWIAEAIDLPGVMAYGETREEALANVEALVVIVIADQIVPTRHS